MGAMPKILIADNSPICRLGLASLFSCGMNFSQTCQAGNFADALAAVIHDSAIEMLAVNMTLTGMHGGQGLRQLRAHRPALLIVAVAATRDRDLILESLSAGVRGFIPTDLPIDEMLNAFHAVLAGQIYVPEMANDPLPQRDAPAPESSVVVNTGLTDRQFEVLSLLATGRSNKEIANKLNICEGTVKVHITAAFRALGVRNRVSAAAALRHWSPKQAPNALVSWTMDGRSGTADNDHAFDLSLLPGSPASI